MTGSYALHGDSHFAIDFFEKSAQSFARANETGGQASARALQKKTQRRLSLQSRRAASALMRPALLAFAAAQAAAQFHLGKVHFSLGDYRRAQSHFESVCLPRRRVRRCLRRSL